MNKRNRRAAIETKRMPYDVVAEYGSGIDDVDERYRMFDCDQDLDGLTDADRIHLDADRERQKYDPGVVLEKQHAMLQEQQRLLHIMRRSM